MLSGRIVFDGLPHELTKAPVRRVYGVEAGEVLIETLNSTALPVAAG